MSRLGTLFVAALLVSWMASGPAWGADKVKVMILDGQNGHKWQETTPAIKDLLEKTGRFEVQVVTAPAAPPKKATAEQKKANEEAWAKFRPDFSKCHVVLTNYCGQPWPDEVKRSLEKFVTDGGGFVAYHFAVAAFPEWDAFNRMIGMGWKDNKFGEGLCYDDSGKVVRRPKGEGPGKGHGPAHVFEVMTRDAEHPIMKGLPAKWSHVKDELYHGQRGPAQDMHILCSAFSDKAGGGTGCHEPIAWTVPCGKGRVFVSLLGHDVSATTAPLAACLLARGVEWAATNAVTLPAPKETTEAAAEKK